MIICPKEKCTGCYACINACPYHCITMQNDSIGILHPTIDDEKCIHCNLCIKSCPNNCEFEFKSPIKCYATWTKDKEKRKKCASGGIATVFSEYIIKQKKGVVYGTRYTKDLIPITTRSETLEDLEYFKGSKYTQSLVGECFKDIKKDLTQNKEVLYIATPCQIAGLYSFLKKEYSNLLTIDLICHGVSPTSYFIDEIEYLKQRNKIPHITDVRFRGNDRKNFQLSLWDDNTLKYCKSAYSQYYFSGFLKGITLRENCYTCNYARPERISDITIGDFIGLGKETPFKYNPYNVSIVLPNTDKGLTIYNTIRYDETNEIQSVERKYAEAIKYGPSLRAPFPRHPYQKEFIYLCESKGYLFAIRKVLKRNIIQNQLLYIPDLLFRRIPRKILKTIRIIKI